MTTNTTAALEKAREALKNRFDSPTVDRLWKVAQASQQHALVLQWLADGSDGTALFSIFRLGLECALVEALSTIESTLAAAPVQAAQEATGEAPKRSILLTGAQVRDVLEFVAPDVGDADQLESEVIVEWCEARTSAEGEAMPAGMYCWLADYPEEGCIGPLGEPGCEMPPTLGWRPDVLPAQPAPPLAQQGAQPEGAQEPAEPTNTSGPAELCPQPAPGLAFDSRGVLVPILSLKHEEREALSPEATVGAHGLCAIEDSRLECKESRAVRRRMRDAIEGAVRAYAEAYARAALAAASREDAAPAPSLPPGWQAVPAKVYVECCECTECGHIGINDAHETDAACNHCQWSGPSPKEDHCPECHRDGTMTRACPECSGRYALLAESHLSAAPALAAPEQTRSPICEQR